MKRAHIVPLLAVVCAAGVVASGFGARAGLWDWRYGFRILAWSTYGAIAVAAIALVALLVPRMRRGHAGALGLAALVAVAAAAVPLYWLHLGGKLPSINDITTDTADPPAFVAIVPLRRDASVPATYAGEATAKAQRAGYPDIAPILVAEPPRGAFDRVLGIARAMGWEIVATDPASGRIEATATTPWFGFKDDVVVRVRPEGQGSRVDIRSLSRVGRSDLGANARRIRAFTARLKA